MLSCNMLCNENLWAVQFQMGYLSSHADDCLIMRMKLFSWGWMSIHEDEYLHIKFIKDLGDLPRQTVGMFKARKMGLSQGLFREWKLSDWSKTFCITRTRWIGHTNFLWIWCSRLCFDWDLGMQRKIIHSGGVTTLNPDSL